MRASNFILFLALGLGACEQGAKNVCGTLPKMLPGVVAKSADDQRQVLYSCMERWAARLAASPDPAPTVARATIAACDEARLYYADWLERDQTPPDKATTREYWTERAIFIAVQTRAGNCYKDA